VIGLGTALKAAAGFAVLCALAGAGQSLYRAGYDAADRKCKAREAEALASARNARDAALTAQIERHRRIDHETHRALADARVRADASRADLERLRSHLAVRTERSDHAPPADPAAGCARVRTERDRLAALLAEGAGLVAEGQQRGDELAVRLRGATDALDVGDR